MIGRFAVLLIFLFINASAFAQEDLDFDTGGTDCGCGSRQFGHSGIDFTAQTGAPVAVAFDGTVVKVEDDENALVAVSSAGFCGKYVVVKHVFSNENVMFTRYAQLGRIVAKDGSSIREGMQVKKGDQIGELGKKALLHFELRPVLPIATQELAFTTIYADKPNMAWTAFNPVDPKTFDDDAFTGQK